jgi:hypothetical protein
VQLGLLLVTRLRHSPVDELALWPGTIPTHRHVGNSQKSAVLEMGTEVRSDNPEDWSQFDDA